MSFFQRCSFTLGGLNYKGLKILPFVIATPDRLRECAGNMEDPDWLIIQLRTLGNLIKRKTPSFKNWVWTNPTTIPAWMQGIGALFQVLIALVMVYALLQNSKIIKTSTEALKIEQATRLNPELECGYNWVGGELMFRNVGDAVARVWFLEPSIYCVQSNRVLKLYHFAGSTTPPLGTLELNPGKVATANKVYSLNRNGIAQFWRKYQGDLLIRIYVEYDRENPTYHRYSGYYNFTVDRDMLDLANPDEFFFRLLTEEEDPHLRTIIDRFNSTPDENFTMVQFVATNEFLEYRMIMERGLQSPIVGTSNGVSRFGGWAKLH
jgi:hypothetical protein